MTHTSSQRSSVPGTRRLTATAGLSLLLIAGAAGQSPSGGFVVTGVTVTDLGTLGGDDAEAREINDGGVIVGGSRFSPGSSQSHAFVYRDGRMTDLSPGLWTFHSIANAINAPGTIVGTIWRPETHPAGTFLVPHAARWRGGVPTLLPDARSSDAADCAPASVAVDIADTGLAVGGRTSFSPVGADGRCSLPEAVLWDEPLHVWSLRDDRVGRTSVGASAISGGGVIVGLNLTNGYRWSAGGASYDTIPRPIYGPLSPPGFLGYDVARPTAVNAFGKIVGNTALVFRSPDDGTSRGFVWDGATASSIDLGALPGGLRTEAADINDQGFVVGASQTTLVRAYPKPASYRVDLAYIWRASMGMRALPRLPASEPGGSCVARGLNNRNPQTGLIQVVGRCETASGGRAVRWDIVTVPVQ